MSGVATRLAVGYVRDRSGEQAVAALLARAGERQTVAQLEDERGWSSYGRWLALLEAAVAVLEDRDAARRIGASVVSQRVGGGQPVPALFGLAPAAVDHHPCRARGGPACEYRLTWSDRRRLGRGDHRRRLAALEDDNALLSAQLESFQQTVADLVATGELGSLLHTLAARSAAAVHARRVLLAIRLEEGADPVVHADGFPPGEAAATAADLLEDGVPDHPSRLVAEVASSRRGYGRVLAENPPGLAFLPGERRLLEAHARLAAAALDAAVALEDANRGRLVATELLKLARSLAEAASEAAVADRLSAATPVLAGADAAARVRDAFAAPFQLDDQPLFVAPSIGLAVFPTDGGQPDELLSNADAAMYQAKRRGSLAAQRFTAELQVEAAAQLSLETDLHLAVAGGQLRVHYQPQVELASGRLVGAEALVRWAHPARGCSPPAPSSPWPSGPG